MTGRIRELREYITSGRHHAFRREVKWDLAEKFAAENIAPVKRSSLALAAVLQAETPEFIPGARIAFLRTVKNLPRLYTPEEECGLREKYSFSEQGIPFNFTVDFPHLLTTGLDALRRDAVEKLARCSGEAAQFVQCSLDSLDALTALIDRYAAAAEAAALTETAGNLKFIRHHAPETFLQALQLFRILHYALWCEGGYHLGAGRVDQLLYPYYSRDLKSGRLTEDEAFELLEEFFLTFNIDSDLYPGVQQGDNGQSLMIGGCDRNGSDAWNILSEKILRASCELKLIDPKINFRVNSATPVERLALGSELTRAGLGFPQYSNDDVVIPALIKWGYAPEDAREYCCAACWEFVIPAVAHELVNLDAVSLPEVLLSVLRQSRAASFAEFCDELRKFLRAEAETLLARYRNIRILPSPLASLFCPVALEKAGNISENGKYHNWGIHGSGFSTAADSLAAIKTMVFDRGEISLAELNAALENNFADTPELRTKLRENTPKLGGNDSGTAAEILSLLVDIWAAAWENLTNAQGGIIRPGTGSAMYYIWHSEKLPATPDGRKAGEPFSANFSPSLDIPLAGPLSVIRAFSAPDLQKVCNGGPLTIELHDSVFTADNAEYMVAELIRDFIRRGGHQLQLNTINRETLLDARKFPEKYPNLIVRVWGWSGRFIELDKVYQDHIIRRSEMSF